MNNVSSIGNHAFMDCSNLDSVYFYSYTAPDLGTSAFLNDDFTIFVPYSQQPNYAIAFVGYTTDVDSIQVDITFISEDNVIDTQTVYYGAVISGLIDPYKLGYDFAGWYDNPNFTGEIYENGGLWDTTEDMTVYADWTPKQYYISFSGYGSENLTDKVVIYDSPVGELPEPTRTGYTFLGWKDSYGEIYNEDTIWQKSNNEVLTSQCQRNIPCTKIRGYGMQISYYPIFLKYDRCTFPFQTPHKYRNAHFQRDRYKHMYMIRTRFSPYNIYPFAFAKFY